MSKTRVPGKDNRKLIKAAEAAGWTCRRTSGGHLRFDRRGCQPVFGALTSKSLRGAKNLRKQLGLDVTV